MINNFKNKILGHLNTDKIYFYWKGRVALYALLKSIEVGKGDEVIIPGFTCVVVPNAIKYLNAIPVYVDIEKHTLNPSLEHFKKAITQKTKVIIVQNTFGLSTQVDEISEFAKSKNIFTIEDCTHGFGGTFKGKPNGSYCDAAFYSTQWNKPFSTGIGGFSVVNNEKLLPKLKEINKHLIKPSFKDTTVLSALLFARKYILNSATYWQLRKLYRWLSKHHLVIGSSGGEELSGLKIPEQYFKGIGNIQVKQGTKNLKNFHNILKIREENAIKYTKFLKKNKKYHIQEELNSNHSFLKYPLLVTNRNLFEKKAEKAKIQLGDWFCSPIHPVNNNLKLWDVDTNKIPVAYEISKQIVNLPTEVNDIGRILEFLENNIDLII